MLVKSRALVLSRLKHNDTSDIACLFTKAEGAVSFVVRIPKNRRHGNKRILFQPLNLLEIEWDYKENQSLSLIRNARCYYPYNSLPYEPVKVAMVSFLSEFLYYALRDEHTGDGLFDYLASSLQWLDMADKGISNFHIALQVHVSRFLGIVPNISEYSPAAVFDIQNACYVRTVPSHGNWLRGEEASFVKELIRMDFGNMHLFRFSTAQRSRLLDLLNTYYRLHVPFFPVLKSIEILREVFS